MAKVIMLSLPARGHINPMLPLAQELVARGEEVSYCLPEEFKPTIASTGATFVPYQLSGRGFRWTVLSCEDLFFWLPLHMAVLSLGALPQLIEIVRAQQPDYLIYDAWCLWGRLVAHILHLPAIRFQSTIVMNEQLGPVFWTLLEQADRMSMPRLADVPSSGFEQHITFRSAVEQLCTTYHLPSIELKSFFDYAEPLNLVSIPPAFQPGVERFDDRFQFIGPSIVPRHEPTTFPFEQLKPQPTLYISMGSVCNQEVDFFKTCFAAFGRTDATTKQERLLPATSQSAGKQPWQVILATGKSDLGTLGTVPENFLAYPYVPQLDVLQQTTVFLTHGGPNSIMEALFYGVPLVVVPQITDQVILAKRVEELGLGIALEKPAVTAASLQEAVTRVTSNLEIHRRVQQMGATLRHMGGARSAVDAILRFSRTEGQKGWSWPPRVEPRSPRQKVFGIGLSKTGTGSLTEALTLLGYRTLHWPADLVTQVEVYRFFATGEAGIHLSVLNDHDALTDTPVCCLYQALDKAYPGSKFILTVREKQAWLRSYHGHWHRYPPMFSERPDSLVAHYSHFLNERLYGTQSADPQILSRAYDRYTAEVFDYFRERPQDLLLLDICGGDGWSKLAPFLGVATPEVPFPWENQARNTIAQDDGKCETSDST